MNYEDILYDETNGVATITINRPDRYNAFRGQTCTVLCWVGHPPFAHPFRKVQRGTLALLNKVFGHIKTDAACADHSHPLAHLCAAVQHVNIANHIA